MSLVDSFYKRLSGQTSFVVTPAQLNITRLQIRITNHPRKWFLNYYWPPLKIYLLSVAYPPTPRPGDLTNCHFNYFSVSWICPTGGGEGGVWCVSSHPNQSAVMTCHKTALWSYQLMGRLCCLLTSNYSSDCRDGGLMDPVAWRWNDRHYPPPILPPGVGLVVGIKIYLQVTDDWWGGGSPGHTQPTHYPEVLLGRWGPAGGLIYLGWGWLEERSWGHISVFSVQYWQSLTVDTSEGWQDHNDIRPSQGL